MSFNLLLFIIGSFLLLVVLGSLYIVFYRPPQTGLSTGTLKVGEHAFSVEIAETIMTRAQGLSGRDPLPQNHGMLFIFSSPGNNGFWMKDMKFPLDFVWVNGHTVVGTSMNIPAPATGTAMRSLPIYYPPEPADQVFEVDAGTVMETGIKKGDAVTLTRG